MSRVDAPITAKQHVLVDGLDLRYLEASSGCPPVILVHGSVPGMTAPSTFGSMVPPLAERVRADPL